MYLLLVAVLVLSLCACQNSGVSSNGATTDNATEETAAYVPLLGVWKWKLDITQQCNDQFSEEIREYVDIKELYYIFILDLKEDGTYSLTVDEDTFKPVRANALADLIAGMSNYLEAMLRANNVDMTVREYMQSRGTTLEAYAEDTMKNLDPKQMGTNSHGYYKVEDGKLYLKSTPFFKEEDASAFTLEGNKLTIKVGLEGLCDSMEFERVEQ